jgi:quaternary ammonium compound-resistance protein SugE
MQADCAMNQLPQYRSVTMAWLILIAAGILETGWAIGLKYTDGFRKPIPSVLTILAIVASMYLLACAARTLPIGTAYAVWTGIGAFGAAVLGIWLLKEPVSAARIFFLMLLLVAIAGLKLTATQTPLAPR